MFQQIKTFLQCVAQTPIQMPTEIMKIASDLDTSERMYTNDLFVNETVIENDWLHTNIVFEPEFYYIMLVFAGIFVFICIESVIDYYNCDGHVDYIENENRFYYYDNRPIGRYRYLCNAQTRNGRRCKRRITNGTRCNLH